MQFTEVKDWTGKYEAISIVIIFWLSVGAEKKIAPRPWRIRCNDVSQEQVCCGGKPLAVVPGSAWQPVHCPLHYSGCSAIGGTGEREDKRNFYNVF